MLRVDEEVARLKVPRARARLFGPRIHRAVSGHVMDRLPRYPGAHTYVHLHATIYPYHAGTTGTNLISQLVGNSYTVACACHGSVGMFVEPLGSG